jgi:hypothetical protein
MIRLPDEELDTMSLRRLKILRSQRIMLLSKTADESERGDIEEFILDLTSRIQILESSKNQS